MQPTHGGSVSVGPLASQGPTSKVILVFNEPENALYWTFEGTERELRLFAQEVIQYNEWIDKYLLAGLAPLSSYDPREQDDPNQIMFAQSRDYQEFFGRPGERGYYDLGGFRFDLIYVDDEKEEKKDDDDDEDDWITTVLKDHREGQLPLEPISTLHELIVRPLSLSDEFGMGFRILPMTHRLMDRHQ